MNKQAGICENTRFTGEPVIQIEDLRKEYQGPAGPIAALKGINLTIRPTEMIGIMGPSGSGKSTLMFILGLLLNPTSGVYRVLGRDILKEDNRSQAMFRRKYVGFVFQSCNLVENTTVYENLEFPLIYAGVRGSEREERIRRALALVNLRDRIHHPSNMLSGGEQQRVAVARALVNNPAIILADEPTGQLDRNNSQLVLDHFGAIASEGASAIIIVTHDPEVAERCTSVYTLRDGILGAE